MKNQYPKAHRNEAQRRDQRLRVLCSSELYCTRNRNVLTTLFVCLLGAILVFTSSALRAQTTTASSVPQGPPEKARKPAMGGADTLKQIETMHEQLIQNFTKKIESLKFQFYGQLDFSKKEHVEKWGVFEKRLDEEVRTLERNLKVQRESFIQANFSLVLQNKWRQAAPKTKFAQGQDATPSERQR